MSVELPPHLTRGLALAVQLLDEGVTINDAQGRLLFANDAAARQCGFSTARELMAAELPEVLRRFQTLDEHGNDLPLERFPSRLAMQGQHPPPMEVCFRERDTGEESWVTLTSSPLFGPQGEVQQVVTLSRLTTSRRHSERALRFLSEASDLLAASLDYHATLESVVRLAVPELADLCALDLVDEDGTSQRVAMAHADPAQEVLANRLQAYYPHHPGASGPARVIQTGQPLFFPEISEEKMNASAQDAAHLWLLRAMGVTAAMIVPLVARGRTLGALSLVSTTSGRRFSRTDFSLAMELAHRAALAVDNARLFRNLQRGEERLRLAGERARKLATEQAARAEAEAAGRRITSILDSISEPLFTLDPDWHLRFTNRPAERMSGLRREELIGRAAREVHPFSAVPSLLQICEAAMGQGATVEFEEQLPDGLWYELRACPSEEGLSVSLRDITARKREQESRTRLARYEALRANVGAALSGREALPAILQSCAEATVQHLGVALTHIWTLSTRDDVLELQATAGRGTEGGGPLARIPLQYELGFIFRENRPYSTNDLGGSPRFTAKEWARTEGFTAFAGYPIAVGGQVIGVLGMFSRQPLPGDMMPALGTIADTLAQGIQRRRAELALAAHAAELARSNAELEQFAYVASHDLQEPLRMVASFTELLARRYKDQLDEKAQRYINFAVDGVLRMQRLIQDLLAFSRVGIRGQPTTPTDGQLALQQALANLRAAAAETGAEITADPLPTVLADETQLEQLLQNLIGNALKFHAPGVRPRVHVSARPEQDQWLFSVRDNGIGIEPQYYERIFVIFQRLHGKGRYPGTGIGLAICKKIVERHGGRIWVESIPGQGSTFWFTLPMTIRPTPV